MNGAGFRIDARRAARARRPCAATSSGADVAHAFDPARVAAQTRCGFADLGAWARAAAAVGAAASLDRARPARRCPRRPDRSTAAGPERRRSATAPGTGTRATACSTSARRPSGRPIARQRRRPRAPTSQHPGPAAHRPLRPRARRASCRPSTSRPSGSRGGRLGRARPPERPRLLHRLLRARRATSSPRAGACVRFDALGVGPERARPRPGRARSSSPATASDGDGARQRRACSTPRARSVAEHPLAAPAGLRASRRRASPAIRCAARSG